MSIRRLAQHMVATLLSVICLSTAAIADDDEQVYRIDLPEQSVADALTSLSEQTDVLVLFSYDLAEARTANPVRGEYTLQEAMDLLLQGTGLSGGLSRKRVMQITLDEAAERTDEEGGTDMSGQTENKTKIKRNGLLGVLAAVFSVAAGAQETGAADDGGREKTLEEIVVTGTNIRGVAPDSSPYFQFDRDDIARTGVGTIQEFIQTLPQNFGGGSQGDIISAPNDRTSSANQASGSSVNLRGVGSGSTLVLLNGARLAPAGFLGDFVDVSLIPLSAVERVEVLPDGASAVYGADAIAGVVNFILRDDYEGAETFFRFGTVTQGDLNEIRAGQTIGGRWSTGDALASYEFYDRDSLSAQDRDFSSDALLPFDLLPEQQSHNILVSGTQEVGPRLSFRGHAVYSIRDSKVSNRNAFQTSINTSESEQLGGYGNFLYDIDDSWAVDFGGGYHRFSSDTSFDLDNVFSGLRKVRNTVDSDIWYLDARLDGDVFTLPGGDAKLAVGLGYREESFTFAFDGSTSREDERNVQSVFVEAYVPIIGDNNRRPFLNRLELTTAGRFEDYSGFGSTTNPKMGLLWSPAEGLNFRGTWGTSFNPPNLGDTGNMSGGSAVVTLRPRPEPPFDNIVALIDFRLAELLEPETSTTWTAGVDWSRNLGDRSLALSATVFDIEFKNRIEQATGSTFAPFRMPEEFFDILIEDPNDDLVSEILAGAARFSDFTGGLFTGPQDVEYIADLRLRNLARTDTRGIDVTASYLIETNLGEFDLGLNSSHLLKIERRITGNSPVFDVVDTVFNPANLRLRGNLSWSFEGINAAVFVNYTDDYIDDRGIGGSESATVDSWTTVDLNLSYDVGTQTQSGLLAGTKLSFSVLNLFDAAPPEILSDGGFTVTSFDPSNADPLGRFVAFQITNAW